MELLHLYLAEIVWFRLIEALVLEALVECCVLVFSRKSLLLQQKLVACLVGLYLLLLKLLHRMELVLERKQRNAHLVFFTVWVFLGPV